MTVINSKTSLEWTDGGPEQLSSASDVSMSGYSCKTTRIPKQSILIQVALLTGGVDKPYAIGLAEALTDHNVTLDVIGSDEICSAELRTTPNIRFLNYRGDQRPASNATKTKRLLKYYLRLIRYIATAKQPIFHILWHTKALEYFDRTFLLLYLKLFGKKIAFTAHNVNAGRRDGTDSLLNRLSLKIQYRLVNHIFVHTDKMKSELVDDFHADRNRITVLPYPTNNIIPDTSLSTTQAKHMLGIASNDKTILFFGRICPYKGLEYLLTSFQRLVANNTSYRLVVAGEPSRGDESYIQQIEKMMSSLNERVIRAVHFIADDEVELYFKAADVLVLPYKDIFQSGVLFLAYSFGLPVIATDVGSFREDIIEGKTGFICKACDPSDLTRVIDSYFSSALFQDLESFRNSIREFACSHHSSEAAAISTRNAYEQMLQ